MSQNGKTREIDPLKGLAIEPRPRRYGSVIKVYREVIDKALAEAALPHIGGRRHMRLPLSQNEQDHHAKVDRFFARLKGAR